MKINISYLIQIIAIVASTVTSIISIIIAMKSLNQTNKSILDAKRSYVVVYSDFIRVEDQQAHYLIIKNFGQSAAIIDKITFSNDMFYENSSKPFYSLYSCSIAPNQFYSSAVKYKKSPYISFDITLEYHDNISKYKETFKINTEAIAKQSVSVITNNKQSELEKTISVTAQEMIRRNF